MAIKVRKSNDVGTIESKGERVNIRRREYTVGFSHDPGRYPLFMAVCHPHRWAVVGDEVLPVITRIPIVNGVNGVEQKAGDKYPNDRALLDMLERRQGFQRVEDEQGDLTVKHTAKKGTFYTFPWETPIQYGSEAKTRIDHEMMAGYQREVLQAHFGGQVHEYGVMQLLSNLKNIEGHLRNQKNTRPEALEEVRRKISVAELALSPAPLKKTRKKKTEELPEVEG